MSRLCRIFGHKPRWGDNGYLRLAGTGVDNVGRVHGVAYLECGRCNENYKVGRLHFTDPAIINHLKASRPDLMATEKKEPKKKSHSITYPFRLILFSAAVIAIIAIALFSSPAKGEDIYQFDPLTREEPIVRMVLQESVGEPLLGQVSVAGVALDRIEDGRWPDTAKDVIYQPWQFTGMRTKLKTYTPMEIERARFAVSIARTGYRPCGKALWYHNMDVAPEWSKDVKRICIIGGHIFYGD